MDQCFKKSQATNSIQKRNLTRNQKASESPDGFTGKTDPYDFIGELYKSGREKLAPILLICSRKKKDERHSLTHFMRATIILIAETHKDITEKRKAQTDIFHEILCKN